MVIAERECGQNVSGEAQKLLTELQEGDIFVFPNAMFLTELGQKIQAISRNKDAISSDKKMPLEERVTPDRLLEMEMEVEADCQKIGLNNDHWQKIEGQFFALVKGRDLRIKNESLKPGSTFFKEVKATNLFGK